MNTLKRKKHEYVNVCWGLNLLLFWTWRTIFSIVCLVVSSFISSWLFSIILLSCLSYKERGRWKALKKMRDTKNAVQRRTHNPHKNAAGGPKTSPKTVTCKHQNTKAPPPSEIFKTEKNLKKSHLHLLDHTIPACNIMLKSFDFLHVQ